uniref:Uncharacterized protein n=1 Tax=Anguilla anguilla TaxID=7936 RepID=A0A0E9VMV9_ANGAN
MLLILHKFQVFLYGSCGWEADTCGFFKSI